MKKIITIIFLTFFITSCWKVLESEKELNLDSIQKTNINIENNIILDDIIVWRIDENCKEEFQNFYEKSNKILSENYDYEVIYYDLLKKENKCILWYYYNHETRHYWKVINLDKTEDIIYENECLPLYNVENDEFSYCEIDEIWIIHMDYNYFISEIL